MSLFVRERNTTQPTVEALQQRLQQCQDKNDFFLISIIALLYFIKEFSLDIQEIKADIFKNKIDKLSTIFNSQESITKTRKIFEKHKEIIQEFIYKEKEFLEDKDGELKNIIEILTQGIKDIGSENQSFNSNMYEKSIKLEEITQLNDIRQIKEELKQELQQLKQAVRAKQERDTKRLTTLTSKVESLQQDFEQAKSAAETDGLTGAFNRAAFDQHLSELIGRNAVSPTPFSLLLLDIDNFKQINDTYGHQVGDRVILALVQQCSGLTRRDDFLARYGGEEFAIILPGASLRPASKKARAICKAIAAARYTIDERKPEGKLAFTVSIGVSTVRAGDTAETIIARADKALYNAKHLGKNRAVSEKQVA